MNWFFFEANMSGESERMKSELPSDLQLRENARQRLAEVILTIVDLLEIRGDGASNVGWVQ